MGEILVAKDFALAVISGNPVAGDTPEEKAENALKLYLAAKQVVRSHNESIAETAQSSFF